MLPNIDSLAPMVEHLAHPVFALRQGQFDALTSMPGALASGEILDLKDVDIGSATFGHAVPCKRTIPLRAIGALGWNQPYRHLCGFLGAGIELGHLLIRVEKQARKPITARVDDDEKTRRPSMRSLAVRPG